MLENYRRQFGNEKSTGRGMDTSPNCHGYLKVQPFSHNEKKGNLLQVLIALKIKNLVISSLGGKILNVTLTLYPDIASLQPVVNGVAGNLVAVQASRLSTQLHSGRSGILTTLHTFDLVTLKCFLASNCRCFHPDGSKIYSTCKYLTHFLKN